MSVELRIWGLINRDRATLSLGDSLVIHTQNGQAVKILITAVEDKRLSDEEANKEPATWEPEGEVIPSNNVRVRCFRCRREFVSSTPDTGEATCPVCQTKTLGYAGERKEEPNGG